MYIRQVAVDNTRSASQWPVDDEPGVLSLTGRQTLLIACSKARKIYEYSYDGKTLATVCMRNDDAYDSYVTRRVFIM